MARAQCIFCEIVSGARSSHLVHDDGGAVAFMDAFPSCDGHVLVVPRTHRASIFELTDAEAAAVARLVRRVACAIDAALHPDGLSVTQANGAAAGQTVLHYHVHLLPRTRGARLGRHAAEPGDPARLEHLAGVIAAALEPAH